MTRPPSGPLTNVVVVTSVSSSYKKWNGTQLRASFAIDMVHTTIERIIYLLFIYFYLLLG